MRKKSEASLDPRIQKQREANARAYAKRGSVWANLTDEQKEKRKAAAKEWKRKNKARFKDGSYLPKPKAQKKRVSVDAWFAAIKAKHEGKP